MDYNIENKKVDVYDITIGKDAFPDYALESIVKRKEYKTIYKSDKWWMVVAIVQIKGFYKIKLYQFYNKDGKWKVMKDFSFNDTRNIPDVITALREASEKLEYYIGFKKRKSTVEIGKYET